jgi:hypothetical protein
MQAHNICLRENAVIHVEEREMPPSTLKKGKMPSSTYRRIGKSAINIDQAAGSMWMTELSVTLMLWACITRGFFNSQFPLGSSQERPEKMPKKPNCPISSPNKFLQRSAGYKVHHFLYKHLQMKLFL